MHVDQTPYRLLNESLMDYQGTGVFPDVLLPWLEKNPGEPAWLLAFSERAGRPIPDATVEDLWRLYALNRVLELLTLRFQRGAADGSAWNGPAVSIEQFEAFAQALHLQVTRENAYDPFHHEITGLVPSTDPVPRLVEVHWPGLMLGSMLMVRAGVTVAAAPETLRPGVADASTLYWAYWRKNRPHDDLAHGWGSNSSWRTSFRRDYQIGNKVYLNVDGEADLGNPQGDWLNDSGLTNAERIELLVNRCFTTTTKPHGDLWPYDDRITLERAAA